MGNKDFDRSSNMETRLPFGGDLRGHPEKRLSQFDGDPFHIGRRSNYRKMGEVAKALINSLGFTAILLGIVANLDNIISILIGTVGFGFGLFKALEQREIYLEKRQNRRDRERRGRDKNRTAQP